MAEMLSTTGQSREQLASQMKHLHTLWRNAKLKLMEKDEELDDAKDRIKTLEKAQEGHVSKISALMTVKELSVELQTRHSFATSQLEQMREENEAMRTELRMANSERELDLNGVYRVRYTYPTGRPTQAPTVSESIRPNAPPSIKAYYPVSQACQGALEGRVNYAWYP